jgi:hypothetical protein
MSSPIVPILYAVAVEFLNKKGLVVKTDMVHIQKDPDDNAGSIRVKYMNSLTPRERRAVRIVAIAPAVGYHCDDNGENLST